MQIKINQENNSPATSQILTYLTSPLFLQSSSCPEDLHLPEVEIVDSDTSDESSICQSMEEQENESTNSSVEADHALKLIQKKIVLNILRNTILNTNKTESELTPRMEPRAFALYSSGIADTA